MLNAHRSALTLAMIAPGNTHPNLADVSPAVSYVDNAKEDGDIAFLTKWNSGRDAVTALFMAVRVRNDYSVEFAVKGATDWQKARETGRQVRAGCSPIRASIRRGARFACFSWARAA